MSAVKHEPERGDTLIEVLVAIAALATVITLFYSIMQSSFSQGQIALERSVTQARMNGQAAMLREAQNRYLTAQAAAARKTWTDILSSVNDGRPLSSDEEACSANTTRKKFFLATNSSTSVASDYGGTLKADGSYPVPGSGMWIEGYKVASPTGGGRAFYAFYLKSCWTSSFGGQDQAMRTIVRLYEAQ